MYIQTDEENNDESSLGGNQNCTTKRDENAEAQLEHSIFAHAYSQNCIWLF